MQLGTHVGGSLVNLDLLCARIFASELSFTGSNLVKNLLLHRSQRAFSLW